jgi:hypothetical protein
MTPRHTPYLIRALGHWDPLPTNRSIFGNSMRGRDLTQLSLVPRSQLVTLVTPEGLFP